MFGDQLGDSRSEETHLGPLAVNERIFIRRNRARRAARHLAAMTCIRPGDCAVFQESIRDPFGSARPPAPFPRQQSARWLRLSSILLEILQERSVSSRGRRIPRGLKRKMSGYPLRHAPHPHSGSVLSARHRYALF